MNKIICGTNMYLLTLQKIAAIEIWHGNYDTKMHCNYVVLYDSLNKKNQKNI